MLQQSQASTERRRATVKTEPLRRTRRIFPRGTSNPSGIPEHTIPFPDGKPLSAAKAKLILSGDFDVVIHGSGADTEIVLFS